MDYNTSQRQHSSFAQPHPYPYSYPYPYPYPHARPHRTYTQKCGKCSAVIEYDARADWPTVSRLINEHWAACPSRLGIYGSGPGPGPGLGLGHSVLVPLPAAANPDLAPCPFATRTATAPISNQSPSLTATTTLTPSLGPGTGIGINPHAHTPAQSQSQSSAESHNHRKSETERKQALENDTYTYNVQPTAVSCRGCARLISLDKRSRYYPGLWSKHRGKCLGIRKLQKNAQLARSSSTATTGSGGGGGVGGSGSTPCAINAEQPSRGASWFKMRDNRRTGGDGISRPSTSTATANYMERDMLRQYELSDEYDSEDDHDGDEEEEEERGDGFKNHIPFVFPALNMQYYDRCRERGEEAWAYRYASRREITENVFEENVGI